MWKRIWHELKLLLVGEVGNKVLKKISGVQFWQHVPKSLNLCLLFGIAIPFQGVNFKDVIACVQRLMTVHRSIFKKKKFKISS